MLKIIREIISWKIFIEFALEVEKIQLVRPYISIENHKILKTTTEIISQKIFIEFALEAE